MDRNVYLSREVRRGGCKHFVEDACELPIGVSSPQAPAHLAALRAPSVGQG